MKRIKREDRISALPDSLLPIILSFLQTIEAVRLSVLSKRWKYIWTKVPVLDFSPWDSANKFSFISFMYKALILNDVPEIKIFRLSNINIFEEFHVQSWVWSIMRRNVLEVDLCSFNRETKLAKGVFLSEKLKVLKLIGNFILPVTVQYFKLPNLEILNLSGAILKDNLLDISSVFPCLRELVLHNWSGMEILNIHSASLRMLKIKYSVLSVRGIITRNIVIQAPNLLYLSLADDFSFCNIKGIQSLRIADIDVGRHEKGERSGTRTLELLQQISGLKILILSNATILSLDFVCPRQLPVFHNLICLVLTDSAYPFVLHMLHHTPNLTSLVVHKSYYSADRMKNNWNPLPNSTPKCILCTLKVIKLYGFRGSKEQMVMVEYFLRTAVVLRVMKIHTAKRDADIMKALSMLSKVPRVSSMCTFTVLLPRKSLSSDVVIITLSNTNFK